MIFVHCYLSSLSWLSYQYLKVTSIIFNEKSLKKLFSLVCCGNFCIGLWNLFFIPIITNRMIPNVSAIYRDLASMADPQSFRSGQPGSNSSSQNNVYAEKQGRHNQLMERLKNAQREMGSINSELNTSHSQPIVSYQESSYPSYRPSYQGQGASRCETQFFSQAEQTQNAGHNWRPPNIRYRHIEDTKPAISIVPQVPLAEINLPERPRNALEKEFYD